jgi:ParB-like chromosome segregation protein Spo0J
MTPLAVERVPAGVLQLYPGNPRRGDVPAIAESLRLNGLYKPLTVQRSTGRVLAGNHTLQAALSLGWAEIDVVFIDCDDIRARKIVLADNRLSDLASYSADDLAALLASIDDVTGTGYSAADLARLLDTALPDGFQPLDPDAAGEPKTVTCPQCGNQFAP